MEEHGEHRAVLRLLTGVVEVADCPDDDGLFANGIVGKHPFSALDAPRNCAIRDRAFNLSSS
jgi:hypothetical protein